jgi:hypothetical protein
MMEGYDGGHASLGTLQEAGAGKEEGQADLDLLPFTSLL